MMPDVQVLAYGEQADATAENIIFYDFPQREIFINGALPVPDRSGKRLLLLYTRLRLINSAQSWKSFIRDEAGWYTLIRNWPIRCASRPLSTGLICSGRPPIFRRRP